MGQAVESSCDPSVVAEIRYFLKAEIGAGVEMV
jgi:hypothetical protein